MTDDRDPMLKPILDLPPNHLGDTDSQHYIGNWPTVPQDGEDTLASQMQGIADGLQLTKIAPALESLLYNRARVPWGSISHKAMRELMEAPPAFFDRICRTHGDAAKLDKDAYENQLAMIMYASGMQVPRSMKGTPEYAEDFERCEQRVQAVLSLSRAMSRWFRSGRRLVNITEKSARALLDVPVDFTRLIPQYKGEDEWKKGHMIHIPHLYTMIYIECTRDLLGNKVKLWGWYDVNTESQDLVKAHKIKGADLNTAWVPIVHRNWIHPSYMERPKAFWTCSNWFNATNFESNPGGVARLATNTQERIDWKLRAHIAINALSALLAYPDIVRVMQPKRKKGRKRTSTLGGVRGARRLTLAEDAMRLAVTKVFVQDDPDPNANRTGGTQKRGLHPVKQHEWRPWVNKTLPTDTIVGTRQKQNRKGEWFTQYKVVRMRGPEGGYTRGSGPLAVNRQKVVTGIDDE